MITKAPSAATLQYLRACLERPAPSNQTCLSRHSQYRAIGSFSRLGQELAAYPTETSQQRDRRFQQRDNQYPQRDRPSQQPYGQYQHRDGRSLPPSRSYPPRDGSYLQRTHGQQQQAGQYVPRNTQSEQSFGRPSRTQEAPATYKPFEPSPPQPQQQSGFRLQDRRSPTALPPYEVDHDRTPLIEFIDPIEKEYTLNHNITSTYVQQVKDSKLQEPERLDWLLRTLDLDVDCVRALQHNEDPKPSVVEITTREALLKTLKSRESKKASHAKSMRESKPKQIEFNWAISGNDLDMKLSNLRKFVEKGKRVELLLANKKRQRKATPEEIQNVMSLIEKTISDIEGCRELKEREGKVGAQLLIVVGVAKK